MSISGLNCLIESVETELLLRVKIVILPGLRAKRMLRALSNYDGVKYIYSVV